MSCGKIEWILGAGKKDWWLKKGDPLALVEDPDKPEVPDKDEPDREATFTTAMKRG